MFEKEAEEIMRQNGCRTHSGNFIQADKVCELIQKGAEFGYSKANEWHYVKDGDLPKENIYLVIKLNDENTCYKYCTGFWEKEEKCFHTLFCSNVDIKDIYAWKEIVLPKLKESE